MSGYPDRLRLTQGADETYSAKANVSASDPIVLAILTLKANLSDADPGALQKKITTTPSAGVGQITADGSTTAGAAVAAFTFTATELAALTPRWYWYDVALKTASGARFPGSKGIATVEMQTTTSTS